MRSKRIVLAGLFLLASLAGCRSAGKPVAQAPAAPLPDFLRAYVGQRRLLLGEGEAHSVSVRQADVAPKGGGCDIAVEIQRASLEKGGLRLVLEYLGRPRLGDRPAGKGCGQVPHVRTLEVAGIGANAGPSDVGPALDRVLATPEAYLASHGAPFDLAPLAAAPTVGARPAPEGDDEERRLGRQVTAWPKQLLEVDPFYSDLSGKVRYEGEVAFDAIVGPDGRLYQPKLFTSLGLAHEEHVLRTLSVWRYEPARKGDERVAAHVKGRLTFRIQ